MCIIGSKTGREYPTIDYNAPVQVEAYEKESDKNLFECRSPIIADEYTHEHIGGITPDELIRQMAQIAIAVITNPRYARDFSHYDAGFVTRTEAKRPFVWLVRENGTHLCELTERKDVAGLLCTMEHYHDSCCLYHFDGQYLRPVSQRTVHEMLHTRVLYIIKDTRLKTFVFESGIFY